jgi:cell division protein FtsL
MKPFEWRDRAKEEKAPTGETKGEALTSINYMISKLVDNKASQEPILTNSEKMGERILELAKKHGIRLEDAVGRTPENIRNLAKRRY